MLPKKGRFGSMRKSLLFSASIVEKMTKYGIIQYHVTAHTIIFHSESPHSLLFFIKCHKLLCKCRCIFEIHLTQKGICGTINVILHKECMLALCSVATIFTMKESDGK